jgi:hypothetical protein
VEPFLFYVLALWDTKGAHMLGYFSKVRRDGNLASSSSFTFICVVPLTLHTYIHPWLRTLAPPLSYTPLPLVTQHWSHPSPWLHLSLGYTPPLGYTLPLGYTPSP